MTLTKGSVMTDLSSIPLLSPPDGMSAKEEERDLREKYPEVSKGTHRVITPDLEDIFLVTKAALSLYEEQYLLAKNQLRRAMTDAERAVSARDGRMIAERTIAWQDGYPVQGFWRDSITPNRSRTPR